MKRLRPNIYLYTSHQKYLADFYSMNKAADRGFSLRSFARYAGLKSYTYLKFVIDGERKLSPKFEVAFADALGLDAGERSYFTRMIALGHETDPSRRAAALSEMLRLRVKSATTFLGDERTQIYREWYYLPLMELTDTAEFREDPKWISRRLKISVPEARRAIEDLEKLQVLKRGADGRLVKASVNFDTSDEISKTLARDYHSKSLVQAAHRIHEQAPEEREFGSITFAVSERKAMEIKERMKKFRAELFELLEVPSEDSAQEVFQWNAHLFRVTEKVQS